MIRQSIGQDSSWFRLHLQRRQGVKLCGGDDHRRPVGYGRQVTHDHPCTVKLFRSSDFKSKSLPNNASEVVHSLSSQITKPIQLASSDSFRRNFA